MNAGDRLTIAAAKVAAGAARDWDEFLAAFRLYKDEQMDLLIKASPDKLYSRQGHAQCAVDILGKLEGCHEKAKKISEMTNGNR